MFCLRQLPRFEWLISPAMRRLNYSAAIVTLAFDFLWLYLQITWPRAEFSAAAETVLPWLILVGAISYAILIVSMIYFWLTFGGGATWSGTFWLIGMAFTPLITVIYCFTSYRRFSGHEPPQQHSTPSLAVS